MSYRDEVKVCKTKEKRTSNAITCYPNHLLCYVRLDERAKDLRTTTSPTQALSDEYPNNFCIITAVKITALFRPGSNLSPR